jgi:hypothetical protein
MIQPTLESIYSSRDMVDVFGGYNHNLRISESEFYDMQNLTSSHYPILAPRNKRGIYEYPEGSGDNHSPNGLISKDALCYADGHKLYINNEPVAGLELEDSPKQLISMGAYIVIMPDKKYVNTKDLTDYGNIEASFNSDKSTISASYEMCKIDGNVYEDGEEKIPRQPLPPEKPTNAQLWIDNSSTPNSLKQYSETNKQWNAIATTYVKISYPNLAASFKQFDAVKITGLPSEFTELNDLEGKVSVLWEAYHDPGEKNDKQEVVRAEGANDFIVVIGFLGNASTKESPLCIERKMPILDFVIESGNRLWGCRYGEDIDGNIVNKIYASKLGDFKNWNFFPGLSTDSYDASCGTDGQWTGAISHLGYPIFFKENCLHKVYGNFPANYQIQTTECRGVQKGCGNSLAIVNERLFYKSRGGVCVYDGSLPSEISSAFGDIHYTGVDTEGIVGTDDEYELRNGAVAGAHNNKYYISMKSEEDNEWYLFVFDVSKGMWHKEDKTRADAFCSCNGEIYFIDHSDKKIKTLLGSGKKEPTEVKWMAETGIMGTSMLDKKYISKLLMRMSLSIGTRIMVSIQYDSCGDWERVYSAVGTHLRSFSIPLKPKRCDHFRLRIEGVGDAKIFSISKTIEQGSEY